MRPFNLKWNRRICVDRTNWFIYMEISIFLKDIVRRTFRSNFWKIQIRYNTLLLLNFLHRMKTKRQWFWLLSHFIPSLFYVRMQILSFINLLSNNHLLHVSLSDSCILTHVLFESSKFSEMCGHYYLICFYFLLMI